IESEMLELQPLIAIANHRAFQPKSLSRRSELAGCRRFVTALSGLRPVRKCMSRVFRTIWSDENPVQAARRNPTAYRGDAWMFSNAVGAKDLTGTGPMTAEQRTIKETIGACIGVVIAAVAALPASAALVEENVEIPVEVTDIRGEVVRHSIRVTVIRDDA